MADTMSLEFSEDEMKIYWDSTRLLSAFFAGYSANPDGVPEHVLDAATAIDDLHEMFHRALSSIQLDPNETQH